MKTKEEFLLYIQNTYDKPEDIPDAAIEDMYNIYMAGFFSCHQKITVEHKLVQVEQEINEHIKKLIQHSTSDRLEIKDESDGS